AELCCDAARLQPGLDRFAQVIADFVDGLPLRDAAGLGGNFGPVTARLVGMDDGAEFHGDSILNAKSHGDKPRGSVDVKLGSSSPPAPLPEGEGRRSLQAVANTQYEICNSQFDLLLRIAYFGFRHSDFEFPHHIHRPSAIRYRPSSACCAAASRAIG